MTSPLFPADIFIILYEDRIKEISYLLILWTVGFVSCEILIILAANDFYVISQ